MFKGIIFSLWIACAMAAGEDSIAGEGPSGIEIPIRVRPRPIRQPEFPTAAAQCAPIVLGAGKWIRVSSEEYRFQNGNWGQRFTFTVVGTPVTQNNIVVEVDRRRTAMGRPLISHTTLNYLVSLFQDSPVTSVRLLEEWNQDGQVVRSLTDPAKDILGEFVDLGRKSLDLIVSSFPSRSTPYLSLTFTKQTGFDYQISHQQLGNAIFKLIGLTLSEARLTRIQDLLTQSDGVVQLRLIFTQDPITGRPQSHVRSSWKLNPSLSVLRLEDENVEFWGTYDFACGQFEQFKKLEKESGFITDEEKNILNVEFDHNSPNKRSIIDMNLRRDAEVEVKEAAPKLREIIWEFSGLSVRIEVLKEILEKVYQEPIGQLNKFSITGKDLSFVNRKLI